MLIQIRAALSHADTSLLPDDRIDHWLRLCSCHEQTLLEALLLGGAIALHRQQPELAFLRLLNGKARTPQKDVVLPLLIKAAQAAGAAKAAEQFTAELATQSPGELDFSKKVSLSDLKAYIDSKKSLADRANAAQIPSLPKLVAPLRDPAKQPVDVLIPVYRGHAATLECLHSLLDAKNANHTAHQLIVLDDASPEPALIAAIAQLAEQHSLTLIHHPINLGYIRGINRAMALHPDRDLVWLNADTRVQGNWLDRLRTWAYSDAHIASVAPLSNNGELLSFPVPQRPFPMPTPEHHHALDESAAQWPGTDLIPLDFPCGFCMYVRRVALVDVGYLDETTLQGGYGEETDWSLRAMARGWRHLAAPNLFVAHRGSLSFGADKRRLVERNNAVIRRRYPSAERDFDRYLARDPLRPARQALQRARLGELRQWMQQAIGPEPLLGDISPHPRQLHLLPPPALSDILSPFFTQAEYTTGLQMPPAGLLWLTWERGEAGLRLTLGAALPALPCLLDYPAHPAPDSGPNLLADLQSLPLQGLVIHRPAELPAALHELAADLGRPCALRQLPLPADHSAANPLPPGASLLLPAAALIPAYSSRWPQAAVHLEPSPPRAHPNPTLSWPTNKPHTFIIGDRLDRSFVAHRWLSLARRLASTSSAWQLVLTHSTPWRQQLWNTGQVLDLPMGITDLSAPQLARLSGCLAVLSLDSAPDATWTAPVIARRFALPLMAPQTPVTQELGARPLPKDMTMPMDTPSATTELHPPTSADTPRSQSSITPKPISSQPAQIPEPTSQSERLFLNIGCGRDNPSRLPETFREPEWRQIRLDIDPGVKPDLLCSSTDLGAIADQSVDAIYSSHSLEHLETHQVPQALAEFHRVLKPDGFALITLPNLRAIAALIAAGRLADTAYESPIGPITALDMLFGHSNSIAAGNSYMAHRTGFDAERLGQSLLAAGFAEVRVRQGECFDLWAFAHKKQTQRPASN
ncbi:glycosyltransferase [Thiorhodovibrio winogradskyi]|uniref:glycosyltransferase n=1 Tax=Thiorhodovibrio winogradskyi TaxID=77007 RepID=UPI002E287EFF|nr:glycosyltransferase [Thiorhodovibrio winogradskyi]